MSVYMPSKGSKTYNQQYQECLDEIHVIIKKYQDSHHLIICGDMNASLHSAQPDERDKLFKQFCELSNIHLPHTYPVGKTYIHENGKKSSQIDYILSSEQFKHHIDSITISKDDQINTSDHSAVKAKIHVDALTKKVVQKEPQNETNQRIN